MTHIVDPLATLRPLREEELEQRAATRAAGGTTPLAYDVYRTGDELVIEFDAPGVAPSEIGLTVEGRAIVVTLRRSLNRGPGIDVIEAGRQHGTFRQRLWLGDRWDLEGLEARAENGVLRVRAPLTADVAARTVEVSGGTPATAFSESDAQWGDSAPMPGEELAAAVHSAA